MHAVQVRGSALAWEEVPVPPLEAGHLRIRVRATAVNRADLLQRAGHYAPPPGKSTILGLECAGEVLEGEGFAPGDRVCALLAGGGYAEQVVCPSGHVLAIPPGLSFEQAAALPEVLTTAWLNLYDEAALQPGERVLVHAGASGVGTAAIQLCRALGNPVWVTVGSEAKLRRCVELGAEGGANRHERDFAELAEQVGGFDVVLDPVGAGYLDRDLRALRTNGRLVIIGLMGGRADTLDLGRLLVKRLRVIGSVLRARSDADKTRILAGLREQVWPLVASGALRPIVDRVLPIRDVERAHAVVASNDTVGKVVLAVP